MKISNFEDLIVLSGALEACSKAEKSFTGLQRNEWYFFMCFGSGSRFDPDSIRSVEPYPDPDSGGQKLPQKLKKIKKLHVLKC
jgi:hypothetical protein